MSKETELIMRALQRLLGDTLKPEAMSLTDAEHDSRLELYTEIGEFLVEGDD